MPFTFAHPAVVLPFSGSKKRGLSTTALVIGSMTPDFEYFLRMRLRSIYSHTWGGLFWFDLPLGFALVLVYEFWVKDALISHLPLSFNRRFSNLRGYETHYTIRYILAVISGVLLGAASHIIWDSFTHPSGYFVHNIGILRRVIHVHNYRFRAYRILQYISTLIGGIVILTVCLLRPEGVVTRVKNATSFWLQFLLVTVVVTAIRLSGGLKLHDYGNLVITIIDGAILGLIIASILSIGSTRYPSNIKT